MKEEELKEKKKLTSQNKANTSERISAILEKMHDEILEKDTSKTSQKTDRER
ncbi:MAG: hypothetical protein J6K45_07705 [Clostridia bacterium]|nr:hypothetical protein [Clostridia bacterium]